MEENNRIETMYAYIDRVASTVEEKGTVSYLEGINEALNFLLDHTMEVPLDLETEKTVQEAKKSVQHSEFTKEEVRKGIQLALLKGFKALEVTNAMMTPDSIGMFIAYLLKKLYDDDEPLSVLDPLSGTGNLLATMHNHYESPMTFTAIEADLILSRITANFLDALDVEHKTLNQDTLAYHSEPFDLVVTDFPIESVDRKDAYFPYQVILHHLE
ncbi:MAG: hypothetical protein ACLFUQ_04070, partial [Candidatus Izemoplasmataceae bacterium]